jgi:hypothetical protein
VKFIDKLSFSLGVASIVILEFLALRHPTHFTQAQLSPSALTFISNQQIFASVSVGQLKVNENITIIISGRVWGRGRRTSVV